MTHRKTLAGAYLMNMFGMTSDDIVYEALPLYHSAAGIVGLGSVISSGNQLLT